jgi:hypothetical protein
MSSRQNLSLGESSKIFAFNLLTDWHRLDTNQVQSHIIKFFNDEYENYDNFVIRALEEDSDRTEAQIIDLYSSEIKHFKITPVKIMKYILAMLCVGRKEFGSSLEEHKTNLFKLFDIIGNLYGFPTKYNRTRFEKQCVDKSKSSTLEIIIDGLGWDKIKEHLFKTSNIKPVPPTINELADQLLNAELKAEVYDFKPKEPMTSELSEQLLKAVTFKPKEPMTSELSEQLLKAVTFKPEQMEISSDSSDSSLSDTLYKYESETQQDKNTFKLDNSRQDENTFKLDNSRQDENTSINYKIELEQLIQNRKQCENLSNELNLKNREIFKLEKELNELKELKGEKLKLEELLKVDSDELYHYKMELEQLRQEKRQCENLPNASEEEISRLNTVRVQLDKELRESKAENLKFEELLKKQRIDSDELYHYKIMNQKLESENKVLEQNNRMVQLKYNDITAKLKELKPQIDNLKPMTILLKHIYDTTKDGTISTKRNENTIKRVIKMAILLNMKPFDQVDKSQVFKLREEPEKKGESGISGICKICHNNQNDTVFDCGHTCCKKCGDKLKSCHMCRQPITEKRRFYGGGLSQMIKDFLDLFN